MGILGEAVFNVGADLTKFNAGIKDAKTSAEGLGKSFGNAQGSIRQTATKVGAAFAPITGLVGALGAGSINAAADLDKTFREMKGLIGINDELLSQWKKDVVELAPTLGQAPKEMAKALFFAASAMPETPERAMEAVVAASKAASAGLGDLAVIVDAATSAMNAYDPAVLSAEKATDVLIATVREGKLEASQLAPVIGDVIPLAAQMGVEFEQIGGYVAALSRTGSDAPKAITGIRAALRSLVRPSKKANEILDNTVGVMKEIVTLRDEEGTFINEDYLRKFGVSFSEGLDTVKAVLRDEGIKFSEEIKQAGPIIGSGVSNMAQIVRDEGLIEAVERLFQGMREAGQVTGNELSNMIADYKALKDEGMETDLIAQEIENRLSSGYGNWGQTVSAIFSDSKGLLAILDLMGPALETNKGIMDKMSDTAGSTATAFDAVKGSVNFQKESAAASIQGLLATLGEVASPLVTDFLKKFVDAIGSVVNWFKELDPGKQKMLLAVIGALASIAPVAATIAAVANPIGAVVAGLAGLAAGIALLVQNWDEIKEGLKNGIENLQNWLNDSTIGKILQTIFPFAAIIANFEEFKAAFQTMWENLVAFFKGDITLGEAFSNIMKGLGSTILGPFVNIINTIRSLLVEGMNAAISAVLANNKGEIRKLLRVPLRAFGINSLQDALIAAPEPLSIPQLAEGGIVRATTGGTLVNVGEGGQDEAVVPLDKGGGSGGFNLLDTVLGNLSSSAGKAGSVLKNVIDSGFSPMTILFELLKPVLDGIMSVLGPLISDALAPLFKLLSQIGKAIGKALAPVIKALTPIILALATALATIFNVIADILRFVTFGLVDLGHVDTDFTPEAEDPAAGSVQNVTNNATYRQQRPIYVTQNIFDNHIYGRNLDEFAILLREKLEALEGIRS